MTAPELPLDAAALDRIESGEVGVGPSRGEKIIAQARAALTLRDELAKWKDRLGAMTAAHRYATDKLAECRAKLAQVVERCGYAELAVTQRDIPLAAAQAENVRLREALKALRPGGCLSNCAAFHGRKPCQDCRDAAEIDAALATPPGSREALRDELTKLRENISKLEASTAHAVTARVVTCVYCGYEYPEGTPTSQDELLTEHIRTCEKHPMRIVEAKLKTAGIALHRLANLGNGERPGNSIGNQIAKDALSKIAPMEMGVQHSGASPTPDHLRDEANRLHCKFNMAPRSVADAKIVDDLANLCLDAANYLSKADLDVIGRVRAERARQDAKWGEQNHSPQRWSLILTEETGEVAKAVLEEDNKAYADELVQVAAVAVAALESALNPPGRCGNSGCHCCAQLCPDEIPEGGQS